MTPSAEYRFDHCRGELGRGKAHRCPTAWLRTARRVARERGDEGMVRATTIALEDRAADDNRSGEREREMRRAAGRRL